MLCSMNTVLMHVDFIEQLIFQYAFYSIPVTTQCFSENRSSISNIAIFDNGNDFTCKVMGFNRNWVKQETSIEWSNLIKCENPLNVIEDVDSDCLPSLSPAHLPSRSCKFSVTYIEIIVKISICSHQNPFYTKNL